MFSLTVSLLGHSKIGKEQKYEDAHIILIRSYVNWHDCIHEHYISSKMLGQKKNQGINMFFNR